MTKQDALKYLVKVANDFKKFEDEGDDFMAFIVGLKLNRASDDFIKAGGTLDELYETVHAILPDLEKGSAFDEEE